MRRHLFAQRVLMWVTHTYIQTHIDTRIHTYKRTNKHTYRHANIGL